MPPRSHTVLFAGTLGSEAARRSLADVLAETIDLAVVDEPARAAPFAALGIPVALGLDVDRCRSSRGAAAFGYAEPVGADPGASPDCADRTRWRDSAFFRVGGDVLFEPTSGGGTFGALTNPSSPVFRRAAYAAMHDAVVTALPSRTQAFFLRDVASPDEIGEACVAAETPDAAFSCTDTDDVSNADGAADWLAGEQRFVEGAARPVYLDGLASYDADPAGTHHDVAESARLASEPNVAGAACDDCFYDGDFERLAYELRSSMTVQAAHKRVVVIDEGPLGTPRFRPTSPRERETALAEIALFYDAELTWFASRSCGRESGVAVCPEIALVLRDPETTVTDPERLRDPGGAYRRAFASCAISGVDYGPCVALVNPKPYAVDVPGVDSAAGGSAAAAMLTIRGYALPGLPGEVPGGLGFRALGASSVDAATGRVHLAAQSGEILFGRTTPVER